MSSNFSFRRMMAYVKTILFDGTFMPYFFMIVGFGGYFAILLSLGPKRVSSMAGFLNALTITSFVASAFIAHTDLLLKGKTSLPLILPATFAEKHVARLLVSGCRIGMLVVVWSLAMLIPCLLGFARWDLSFASYDVLMYLARIAMAYSVAFFLGACSVSLRSVIVFWLLFVSIVALAFLAYDLPDSALTLAAYAVICVVANVLAYRVAKSAQISSIRLFSQMKWMNDV